MTGIQKHTQVLSKNQLCAHPLVKEVVLVGGKAGRAVALAGLTQHLVGPAVAGREPDGVLLRVEVQLFWGAEGIQIYCQLKRIENLLKQRVYSNLVKLSCVISP